MAKINFKKKDDTSVDVAIGNETAGTMWVDVYRPGNNQCECPWRCKVVSVKSDDKSATIEFHREDEDVTAVIELTHHDDGLVGKFAAFGKGHCNVRLIWDLPAGKKGYPFVPAFMYGRNEGGKSPDAIYPQLTSQTNPAARSKPWLADQWLVRADRSSHGTTSVICDDYTYAIGGRDVSRFDDGAVAEKNGIGMSSTDPHRLTFSLGFVNKPYVFCTIPGRNYYGRPDGYVNLDKGKASSEFFMFLYKSENRAKAAGKLLRLSYDLLHDTINDAGSVADGIEAISAVLAERGYCKEAKNFYTSFRHDSRPELNIGSHNFCSGWAGGSRTVYPFLVAAHQLKNKEWLQCARDIFDNFAENAYSKKSGLFNENYDISIDQWNCKGWWHGLMEQPGHSGYVNGQLCHYLLAAYQIEKDAGKEQTKWLESAIKVLDRIAKVGRKKGRFGFTLSTEDGSAQETDGFTGCWFTPAFANAYRITGEQKYLDVARQAMDAYRGDVEAFHVFGGPHDIWKSPDEEGILAWIDAARIMHEITGEQRFLDDLVLGLDYEFSWKFAYNVVNEVEPLKSMNWCSTGGSVTSVNNSHIHPMGVAIAPSILYAVEQLDDEYLKSRLIDTVRWGLTLYLHHDGEYGWGKKGMINERYCYTDCLLLERFPDGSPASTWFCAHSWASGAVLEGLVGRIFDTEKTNKKLILG